MKLRKCLLGAGIQAGLRYCSCLMIMEYLLSLVSLLGRHLLHLLKQRELDYVLAERALGAGVFRITLRQPSHAMYIFVAISIGLGSGIGALGIAAVISAAFVYATLIIWKIEYGKILSGPIFSMLTRRDRTEEDF